MTGCAAFLCHKRRNARIAQGNGSRRGKVPGRKNFSFIIRIYMIRAGNRRRMQELCHHAAESVFDIRSPCGKKRISGGTQGKDGSFDTGIQSGFRIFPAFFHFPAYQRKEFRIREHQKLGVQNFALFFSAAVPQHAEFFFSLVKGSFKPEPFVFRLPRIERPVRNFGRRRFCGKNKFPVHHAGKHGDPAQNSIVWIRIHILSIK